MPLPDEVRAVALAAKVLRQHCVLELRAALLPELDKVGARRLELVGHAPGEQRGAARTTQPVRVEGLQPQPCRCEGIDRWRLEIRVAVTDAIPPEVIGEHQHDVRTLHAV